MGANYETFCTRYGILSFVSTKKIGAMGLRDSARSLARFRSAVDVAPSNARSIVFL